MKSRKRSCLYRIFIASGVLLGVCLVMSVLSAFGNGNLPTEDHSDHLNAIDKARLSEAIQLKKTLGDLVWQGWGSSDHPMIIWNRSYEFLFQESGETPSGWSQISGEDINGKPYYRRAANDPQNFAVRVDGVWTASMATKQTTDVFLIQTFRDSFPSPIKQIFPYKLLMQPSETQIGGLLHETFHVYQYHIAPQRMETAESIHRLGENYEKTSEAFSMDLRIESKILADALKARTREEKIELVRQFLAARDLRRNDAKLGGDLIDYEKWLEWEEGTAKYIELAILRQANQSQEYQPIPELNGDHDFNQYLKFDQRWSQEMFQLRYQTSSGETQFYMTGMAQAFLLDDLMPDWKAKYWRDGIFLEDLLRLAVNE